MRTGYTDFRFVHLGVSQCCIIILIFRKQIIVSKKKSVKHFLFFKQEFGLLRNKIVFIKFAEVIIRTII